MFEFLGMIGNHEQQAGHAKWVATLRARPKELRDVNETGIEEFAQAIGATTRGHYLRNEV